MNRCPNITVSIFRKIPRRPEQIVAEMIWILRIRKLLVCCHNTQAKMSGSFKSVTIYIFRFSSVFPSIHQHSTEINSWLVIAPLPKKIWKIQYLPVGIRFRNFTYKPQSLGQRVRIIIRSSPPFISSVHLVLQCLEDRRRHLRDLKSTLSSYYTHSPIRPC